jgi:hypothetical protein
MMVATFLVVTVIAIFFFVRVLRTSPKQVKKESESDI